MAVLDACQMWRGKVLSRKSDMHIVLAINVLGFFVGRLYIILMMYDYLGLKNAGEEEYLNFMTKRW